MILFLPNGTSTRHPIGGTPSLSGGPEQSVDCWGALSEASNRAKPVQYPAAQCRTGIRIHRGTKPEHSTGCVLVPPEKECLLTYNILKAQNAHEEIILEVIDFTPGTEYGYNHPCPPELQKP